MNVYIRKQEAQEYINDVCVHVIFLHGHRETAGDKFLLILWGIVIPCEARLWKTLASSSTTAVPEAGSTAP